MLAGIFIIIAFTGLLVWRIIMSSPVNIGKAGGIVLARHVAKKRESKSADESLSSPETEDDDDVLVMRDACGEMDDSKDRTSEIEEPIEDSYQCAELEEFNNVIYHVKLLGHEDPRFQSVALKAYEIISKYSDCVDFYKEILKRTEGDSDFATEIIRFIIKHKGAGITDVDLLKKIREKYLCSCYSSSSLDEKLTFSPKPQNESNPIYLESEISEGSRQLSAKSKIAHKHKAIQYANVIGGKLAEDFAKSETESFHAYLRSQCSAVAAKGDSVITTEEFAPHKNLIAVYKKSKKKSKSRSISANIITPKHEVQSTQVDLMLRILDKLTSSKLPKYEMPTVASAESIVQREYKKTNPFDVYTDLVTSEYTPEALKDKRFAILYQLILFISDCLECGMSEEETINALSSLRVVRKQDIQILRDRESRFQDLSPDDRNLVIDSEICGDIDMTNLYVDLILRYRKSNQAVSLNDYLMGVLIKNYKESASSWKLLKYVYLKSLHKSDKYILEHRAAISESYFTSLVSHGVKGANDKYYSLKHSMIQLKEEYVHCVGMTRYNFDRDKVSVDMLNIETLKQYLPKRFDNRGRLCSPVKITPMESVIFDGEEKRIVGDYIYIMMPIRSLTTSDLYGLLLTVKNQQKKAN